MIRIVGPANFKPESPGMRMFTIYSEDVQYERGKSSALERMWSINVINYHSS